MQEITLLAVIDGGVAKEEITWLPRARQGHAFAGLRRGRGQWKGMKAISLVLRHITKPRRVCQAD
jgi:hypothetical protein